MPEVKEYLDDQGRSPYERWLNRLGAVAAAKIVAATVRLEKGNFSNVKGVGAGVSERKINSGPGYRIYFGRDGKELVILLGGGSKKTQRADITEAQKLWKDYKARKRRGE